MTAGDCFATPRRALSVREALERLRMQARPLVGQDTVSLDEALGRALAAPLISVTDAPAVDCSAVDGYAFLAPRDKGAARRRLHGRRSAAGHPLEEAVSPDAAVRILTGAPMPAGTDSVLMQEDARFEDCELLVPPGFPAGSNRRRRSEDFTRGDRLIEPGQVMGPQHLALAARAGVGELVVHQRLKVALASSGDELREPGEAVPGFLAYDSNRVMLRALLRSLPIDVMDLGILPDAPEVVKETLRQAAAEADIILTSGGASHGDEDHVVSMVEAAGGLSFWEVRMKPGRPLAIGHVGPATFIGLPGNPVASLVAFLIFCRPFLLALAGADWPPLPLRKVVTAADLPRSRIDRTDLWRARLVQDAGLVAALPLNRDKSHILSSLAQADGFIVLEEGRTTVRAGELVDYAGLAELGCRL